MIENGLPDGGLLGLGQNLLLAHPASARTGRQRVAAASPPPSTSCPRP
ncbi:hypothetical protein [Streptomyces sp. SAI-163]